LFWKAIGTGLFSGKLPLMPGTWGSLLAAAAIYLLWPDSTIYQLVAVALTSLLSVISSDKVSKELGDDDPDCVVIDEILGMEVSLLGMDASILNVVLAFAIFRAVDIMKPYPIRLFEKLPGGFGITVDDAVAGVYANLILRALLAVLGGLNV